MKKILVAGAGLAGCTAARLLAEQGHQLTIYEAREHIGGNIYDEKQPSGITRQVYGPHIFHTRQQEIWQFVTRFTKMRPFQHRVLSYTQGQLYPFPINRDTICQLYGINLANDEVPDFLEKEVKKAQFDLPAKNFRDAIVSQVGEYLYHCFFENYTAKQWQRDPSELSAEVAGRIPVRANRDDRYFTDRYQGIPLPGYTAMCEKMLDHPQIEVGCKHPYKKGDEQDFDLLIYTGRLDDFFDRDEGELSYRSVHFDFQTLDEKEYQPAAVVNYPNDYDFTRITEFKHMTGEHSSQTEICLEYPSAEGVPCYVVLNRENLALRERYQAKAKALEHAEKVIFLGRLAEYKYYNMDQVIARAMEVCAQI